MTNHAKIINDLWTEAMDHLDWHKKGAHVLEISMETHMSLQKFNHDWWYGNMHRKDDGKYYFRGDFLVKVIHEPLPKDMTIAEGPEPTKTVIPMWDFMAIHVQRDNGRYRYHDWEGNDERCT